MRVDFKNGLSQLKGLTQRSQNSPSSSSSILKVLREKKNLTQAQLARILQTSRKKLHTIESKSTDQIKLGEMQSFAKALGYNLKSVLPLALQFLSHESAGVKKILLDRPVQETVLGEGAKMQVFLSDTKHLFIGVLLLEPQRSVMRDQLPLQDLVFGIVHEGTLLIDTLGVREQVIKSRQVFYFDEDFPAEFCNTDHYNKLSVLCFSVLLPDT